MEVLKGFTHDKFFFLFLSWANPFKVLGVLKMSLDYAYGFLYR